MKCNFLDQKLNMTIRLSEWADDQSNVIVSIKHEMCFFGPVEWADTTK